MIKTIKKVLIGPLLVASLVGQESLFWEIADPIVNSEFIESYINRLIEVDKFEENSIQASFSIIVQMDVGDEKIELSKLKQKTIKWANTYPLICPRWKRWTLLN